MRACARASAETLAALPPADLVRALTELPLEFRQVVYLTDIEGLTYRETAAILNTPLETVMASLHRARTSLRERLVPASRA